MCLLDTRHMTSYRLKALVKARIKPTLRPLRKLLSLVLRASLPQSGGGRIDLREYVVALSVVCRPARTLDTVQLAFKASRGVT